MALAEPKARVAVLKALAHPTRLEIILILSQGTDGHMQYQITQGVEMGRPSRIVVDVERDNGQISKTSIAGECVEVISGRLSL